MNGATADPCVKTISAPSNAIIMKIGASQYFLRVRIKIHSSLMNDIIFAVS